MAEAANPIKPTSEYDMGRAGFSVPRIEGGAEMMSAETFLQFFRDAYDLNRGEEIPNTTHEDIVIPGAGEKSLVVLQHDRRFAATWSDYPTTYETYRVLTPPTMRGRFHRILSLEYQFNSFNEAFSEFARPDDNPEVELAREMRVTTPEVRLNFKGNRQTEPEELELLRARRTASSTGEAARERTIDPLECQRYLGKVVADFVEFVSK